MIKITKSLKIELVTLLIQMKLTFFTFLINEKKYVEHNNICAKRRHNVKIIIRKRT